jgi:hypothetical protein
MAKKPWRVVEPGEDAGRLTTIQVLAAIEAVKARKEAERKQALQASRKRKPAVHTGNGTVAASHDADAV